MGTIRLQNVTKQFGPRIILEDVSLELHSGETAALIGANGAGKTTLFRLMAGHMQPDLGTVTRSKGLEVGYLPQEPDLASDKTLREAVAEAFDELMMLERKLQDLAHQMAEEHDSPELDAHMQEYDRLNARFEAAGGYKFEQRLNEVLGGLGFSNSDYELPVSALSGGQKCRAALAKLLLQERQFLLLDEPTNHLDIDAVRWLEKFLAGHHGGAVIISHDRYLLDRLAERTIDVAQRRVHSYPGNYSNYVQVREVRRLTQARQYERDREYIQQEQAFIDKHIAGQRTKEAQGRRKRLERRIEAGEFVLEKPDDRRTAKISFDGPARNVQRGKELIRVEDLRKQYDDKLLFTGLTLGVDAGQRVGITGPNGTGKSTLLRIILGQVEADEGELFVSPTARIGYFAQDAEELDPDRTVVQELCEVRPDFLESDARNYAARFLFLGEDPFKRVGQLSGGEQSRVRFMKLILTSPDVLVLDEPTNHLDIASRETLEASLAEFPGTIIAVSHDRFFLDRIAQRLLVIRPEGHKLYGGNYTYYIEQIEQARAAESAEKARKGKKGGAQRSATKPSAKPKTRFQKMKLDELEALISEHEQTIATLQQRFGDPEVYKDVDKLTELRAEFDSLKAELAEAEEAWLEKVEKA